MPVDAASVAALVLAVINLPSLVLLSSDEAEGVFFISFGVVVGATVWWEVRKSRN